MKIILTDPPGLTSHMPGSRHGTWRTALTRWASCFLADAARTVAAVWGRP